jgi:hypothetical protein
MFGHQIWFVLLLVLPVVFSDYSIILVKGESPFPLETYCVTGISHRVNGIPFVEYCSVYDGPPYGYSTGLLTIDFPAECVGLYCKWVMLYSDWDNPKKFVVQR